MSARFHLAGNRHSSVGVTIEFCFWKPNRNFCHYHFIFNLHFMSLKTAFCEAYCTIVARGHIWVARNYESQRQFRCSFKKSSFLIVIEGCDSQVCQSFTRWQTIRTPSGSHALLLHKEREQTECPWAEIKNKDAPSSGKPASAQELLIVFRWWTFLSRFF